MSAWDENEPAMQSKGEFFNYVALATIICVIVAFVGLVLQALAIGVGIR